MKKRNIFWGVVFLVIAACILITELGYFPGINIFKLVLAAALIALLIQSIPHKNFAGILFPIFVHSVCQTTAYHESDAMAGTLDRAFWQHRSFLFVPEKALGKQTCIFRIL